MLVGSRVREDGYVEVEDDEVFADDSFKLPDISEDMGKVENVDIELLNQKRPDFLLLKLH